jgi:hypothetical protein
MSQGQQLETSATRLLHRSLGYFVTLLVENLPDGRQRISHARWHRKGLAPIELAGDGSLLTGPPAGHPWRQLWAPSRLAWWIAILFIIGSACFAAGGFATTWPRLAPALLTQGSIVGAIFFVGSLFFTAAAWLQLEEAINGDIADVAVSAGRPRAKWRWLAWNPRSAGYSAGLLQFAGTLLFNINTADAMLSQLTWWQEDARIWAPDIIGSTFFLLSSYLAVVDVSHGAWSWQPRQLSWWIVMINLLGSIAFMVSAIANWYLPSSGDAVWVWGASLYTLIGALCFLTASYLMIPEQAGAGRSSVGTSGLGTRRAKAENIER